MYICIDIGGTAIKYGLASADGQLIETKSTPTHAHQGGGPGIVRTVRRLIRQYTETGPLLGIALSTAGMVDPQKGRIFYALADSIPDYTGTEWKEILEGEFHIPCAVENDVNCAALGELWLGAGKGCTSAFMMTISTSIGGCALYDGHIIHCAWHRLPVWSATSPRPKESARTNSMAKPSFLWPPKAIRMPSGPLTTCPVT